MALVNNINDIASAGLKISFSSNNARLPDFEYYEQMYLVPLLGSSLYNVLVTSGVPNTHTRLRILALRASVSLAYWHELPFQHGNISDTGVFVITNENHSAAPRWVFEKMRESLAEKGLTAIELMLQELHQNKATFNWEPPAEHKDSCFLHAAQFNQFVRLHQPYRTFDTLRPLVRQVEEEHLHNAMGASFYKALLTSTEEASQALVLLIRKAVAQLTLKAALAVLPVRIGVEGVTVFLRDNNDTPQQGRSNAPSETLNLAYKNADENGRSYLIDAISFLRANASATVFADYFNSSYYRAPNSPQQTIDNSQQNMFVL